MRDVLFVMPFKKRGRTSYLGPLCKPFAMPLIIFRDRVKLRQIVGKDFYVFLCNGTAVISLNFIIAVVAQRVVFVKAVCFSFVGAGKDQNQLPEYLIDLLMVVFIGYFLDR